MQLPADLLALARVEPTAGPDAGPLAALTGDPLEQLIGRLARRLGTRERRTAAATLHLGLAGRLWTLSLGGLRHGGVPDLAQLRWWDVGGVLRLHLPAEVPRVQVSLGSYVQDLLAPLEATLAVGLVRGNLASSLVSTARMLGVEPGPLLDGLLRGGPLDGALAADGRRRSCCLFYRVPGGGVCSDCCLRAPVR